MLQLKFLKFFHKNIDASHWFCYFYYKLYNRGVAMGISNAEKQERYRKKEELKKYANQIFFEWQMRSLGNYQVNPQDIKNRIEAISNLPSKWTDEDYIKAKNSIEQVLLGTYNNPHLLSNDINDARNLRTVPDSELHTLVSNVKKAEINAKKLVAHIQSLFSLMNTNISDQAAILAELMRIIGRNLLEEKTIPMTNANTQCLASIGSQFGRPNGFTKKLARILAENLDSKEAELLANEIIEYSKDNKRKLFNEI